MALAVFICGGCGEAAPTSTRYDPPRLDVVCGITGESPLMCRAVEVCGGYGCAPGVGGDVTERATWLVDHQHIVRVVGAGRFMAVSEGDTVVRAEHGAGISGFRPVSVIEGSPPLPTNEIFGSIRDASGPLDGVTVEIIEGQLQGRKATSGVPPALIPGFYPAGGSGYFRILGVPPGSYRVRIGKMGYVAQERAVTVTIGSPVVDVTLQPE